MKKLDIWSLRKTCYRNLSGGQQQRVLLARALCATTKLILLDEPVTGLDPKATAEFYQLIAELNKAGITIIMVSHDIQASVQYASHVLHIGKKQMFYGEKEEYLEAWHEYWADRALGFNSVDAICRMYGKYGGIARKQSIPEVSGFYYQEIEYMLSLIQMSIENDIGG